jgi:hypothetical protein
MVSPILPRLCVMMNEGISDFLSYYYIGWRA